MRKIFFTLIIATNSIVLFAQDKQLITDTTKITNIKLGEVFVKSSYNQSKIKNTPASLTYISEKQINNQGLLSLEDVSAIAPNFNVLNYGTKIISPVYIRGIGSKKNSPSVGLYVDGIPYYEDMAMSFDFYDLERIEILRGPQGSLYGRNTIGGLINIKTLSPLNYKGLRLRITQANYGLTNASVGYYNKFKRLAYSLSVNYRKHNGFFKNTYNNTQADKLQSFAARNRLILRLNNNLFIENTASLEQSYQSGYPYGLYNSSDKTVSDVSYNQPASYKRFMFNNGLKAVYSKNNWKSSATLAYQIVDDNQNIDQDFLPDSMFYAVQNRKQDLVSFEGVIRSKNTDKYKWLFGVFGFLQDKEFGVDVDIYPKKARNLKDYSTNIMSSGLFHQSVFKPINSLELTAGIRYNYETSLMKYKSDIESPTTTITEADTTYPKFKEHIILPKLAVLYSFKPFNIYASYASGYKPGGFNITFEKPEQLNFKKETSHNFELGFKGYLINNILYTDVTFFVSYLKGQQISRSLNRGTYLDNSGTSENKGVEFALNLQDIKGFEANINYGYTHALVEKYIVNDSVNFNKNSAPFVPLNTLNVSLAKTFKINGLSFIESIKIQTSYRLFDKMFWNIQNTLQQERYGLLNSSVFVSYNNFSIQFWCKNILNTQYNSYVFSAFGNNYAQKGTPRQMGATLTMKF